MGNLLNVVKSIPYCGSRKPFALILEVNSSIPAGVLFRTNGQVEEQGFNLSYFAVNTTSKICK